jgi:hypothetical protein
MLETFPTKGDVLLQIPFTQSEIWLKRRFVTATLSQGDVHAFLRTNNRLRKL